MAEEFLNRYSLNKNPIAQSFFVDTSLGMFLTKIDLFFKTVSTDNSTITLEIRPMESGVPDQLISIPGSTVVKNQTEVTANSSYSQPSDTLTPTTFEFDAPVYLNGNTFYSFVVNASVKGYSLFGAQIEEFQLGSTQRRVDKNLVTGNVFQTDTGFTFAPVMGQDLAFKLYRAKFTPSSSLQTQAVLCNSPVPKKLLSNNPFTTTSGSSTVVVDHPDAGFLNGDKLYISGATAVGGLDLNTTTGWIVTKIDPNGLEFTAGGSASSSTVGGGNNVLASQNYLYNNAVPNLEYLPISGTRSYVFMKAITGESYSQLETGYQRNPLSGPSFLDIYTTQENYAENMHVIANSQNEAANSINMYHNNKSLQIAYEMTTSDEFVAAPLDLERSSFTAISHRIDNPGVTDTIDNQNVPINFAPETDPSGGSAVAKHVMSPVNLEIGAKGLKILFAGNCPPGANIDVYFRTSNSDENILEKSFVLAQEYSSNPKTRDRLQYYEYEYIIGGQYESTLDEFDTFQVKFVFESTNQALVPSMKDVRIIALSR